MANKSSFEHLADKQAASRIPKPEPAPAPAPAAEPAAKKAPAKKK